MFMCLCEICVHFNLLGLQQKSEQSLARVPVSKEYPLRTAFEVISAEEPEGLPVVDLGERGLYVAAAEDQGQGFKLCDFLTQAQVSLPLVELISNLLEQCAHLHGHKLIVYLLLRIYYLAPQQLKVRQDLCQQVPNRLLWEHRQL